ncbi:MAG: type 2 isopentenyl-diphosphate Delta-isomerase [Deltaproteobacteria bacterium]|nr:type 2 isopentenyl-diphosphate Delta-isomerase [Deltaproteobacteria bacterium]
MRGSHRWDVGTTQRRKGDHIRICLDEDVSSGVPTGLDEYILEYDALPEVNLEDVDIGCSVLGKGLTAPILIGAITGGTSAAGQVNENLAAAAERLSIGMCLGSQRAMLEDASAAATYDVRRRYPEMPLVLGNLGAVQLNYGVSADTIRTGLDLVDVDGLIFHLNPLQEAIQPEGDTRFEGLTDRMAEVIPQLGLPVLVKEVGAGISTRTARKLAELPLAGVEVAGVGGTSWTKVEAFRAPGTTRAAVGHQLASFGVTTAESIVACRKAMPDRIVVGSGGIRTGYQIAVALALGADAVALARPLLSPAVESAERVVEAIQELILSLKVVMFGCGCRTIEDLKKVRVSRRSLG